MDIEQRIRQFSQMAEADPENELGHFSLGKAFLEAGRWSEAIEPLRRAIGLNPAMSKAYQLLGDALNRSGQKDEAIRMLTEGVRAAERQGDRMPCDAMAAMLEALGAPVPVSRQAATASPSGTSQAGFACSRCGSPHGQLEKPPFKGELGVKIHANVCQRCWREWILVGTKVINELGLVLSTPQGQDAYDQHMVEFLQLEGR